MNNVKTTRTSLLKGYFHSTRLIAALRIGLPSVKQNSARFGRTAIGGFFGLFGCWVGFPYFGLPFNLAREICTASVDVGQVDFIVAKDFSLV